jgi:hypothetical protein
LLGPVDSGLLNLPRFDGHGDVGRKQEE